MTHDAEQRIRERAYHLWEAEGRPHGREHDFWEQATREEHAHAAHKPAPAAEKPVAKAAAKPVPAKPAKADAKPKAAAKPRKGAAAPG